MNVEWWYLFSVLILFPLDSYLIVGLKDQEVDLYLAVKNTLSIQLAT